VNAAGKNNSNVFFFPKLLLNLMSTRPVAVFDLSVKSGACEPTLIAINLFYYFDSFVPAHLGNLPRLCQFVYPD
jgi:hypothetical protein